MIRFVISYEGESDFNVIKRIIELKIGNHSGRYEIVNEYRREDTTSLRFEHLWKNPDMDKRIHNNILDALEKAHSIANHSLKDNGHRMVWILHGDAEIKLGSEPKQSGKRDSSDPWRNWASEYIEKWYYTLLPIMSHAIDAFLQTRFCIHGKIPPVIVPFIPFPSSEIVVAVAKPMPKKNPRTMTPRELKENLYGTSDIRTAERTEKLKKVLDESLNDKSLNRIYSKAPEMRPLLALLDVVGAV